MNGHSTQAGIRWGDDPNEGLSFTEVPELQGVEQPKSIAPPPYSPNAWAKLAQIFGGSPFRHSFQDHRGDF